MSAECCESFAGTDVRGETIPAGWIYMWYTMPACDVLGHCIHFMNSVSTLTFTAINGSNYLAAVWLACYYVVTFFFESVPSSSCLLYSFIGIQALNLPQKCVCVSVMIMVKKNNVTGWILTLWSHCCLSVSASPLPQRPWVPLNQPDTNRPSGMFISSLKCVIIIIINWHFKRTIN